MFGVTGGYIRYLYATAQSQTDVRTVRLLQVRLFDWKTIETSDNEKNTLKTFLKEKYKLKWITDQVKVKKEENDKKLTLKDEKNNSIFITLGDDSATLYINEKEEKEKFVVKKEDTDKIIIYALEHDPVVKGTFYSSLYDVALIFLAPLLAAAVWFLIIQNGVDPVKGIFVLAVVSFAVGLATTNVVDALVNFKHAHKKSPDIYRTIYKVKIINQYLILKYQQVDEPFYQQSSNPSDSEPSESHFT